MKKRALFLGVVSAFILRFFGLLFTVVLIRITWLQVIGGLYLLYVAIPKQRTVLSPTSLWKAICYIEGLDILFAIDSILSAFALVALFYPRTVEDKLWIIYIGGLMGLLAVRALTTWLIRLMKKHPFLERVAFFLIAFVGLKLILSPLF